MLCRYAVGHQLDHALKLHRLLTESHISIAFDLPEYVWICVCHVAAFRWIQVLEFCSQPLQYVPMQGHLEGMIGKPSGLIESLPKTLRNRLAYLGELQDQHDELAEKLHEEQVALQRKYEKLWGEFHISQSCFYEIMNVQINSIACRACHIVK